MPLAFARSKGADTDELCALYREVDALSDELALRFGAPKTAVMQ